MRLRGYISLGAPRLQLWQQEAGAFFVRHHTSARQVASSVSKLDMSCRGITAPWWRITLPAS